MSDFSDRLREERARLELNQVDFGMLGGVKKNAQLSYESGERSPSVEYLLALYEAKVDVVYLITGSRAMHLLLSDEQQVIDGYKRLDGRGKAGVLALVAGLTTQPNIEDKFEGTVGQVVHGNITAEQTFTFSSGEKKA